MRHWTENWMLIHAIAIILAVFSNFYFSTPFLFIVGILSFIAFFLIRIRKERNVDFLWQPANLVSILRLGLLFFLLYQHPSLEEWTIFTLALVIVALDGVDGYLARRFNTVSQFGSYLDMETDAFYVMSMATILFHLNVFGLWILGTGLIRYLYFPIIYFLKPIQKKEDRNYLAQVIAVILMLSLPTCLILPEQLRFPIMAIAAFLLVCSFLWGFIQELKSRKQFKTGV